MDCSGIDQFILTTQNDLDELSKMYASKLSQYPPDLRPTELLNRVDNCKSNLERLSKNKDLVEKSKNEIHSKIASKMQENKEMLEHLLTLTEFDGDYQLFEHYLDLVSIN